MNELLVVIEQELNPESHSKKRKNTSKQPEAAKSPGDWTYEVVEAVSQKPKPP